MPNVRLRDISEAIDAPEELRLVAVNGQDIPFIGWMEVMFGLVPDERKDKELIIPVLVMRGGHLCHPIIGYNVIEQVVNCNGLTQPHSSEMLGTVTPNLEGNTIRAFIKRVQAETSCEYILKTTKERVHVPKHTSVQVECSVQSSAPKEERVLLYEPDVNPSWPEGLEFCETLVKLRRQTSPHVIVTIQNPTNHDIMLKGKTVIGSVHPILAVYAVDHLTGRQYPCHPYLPVSTSSPVQRNERLPTRFHCPGMGSEVKLTVFLTCSLCPKKGW